jgi:hypothetical protein
MNLLCIIKKSGSVPLVSKWLPGLMAAFVMTGISPLVAADSAATVTEAVNEVTHGSSQSTDTLPAKAGTQLQDGEYLKTGVKSRAELELANQSVTRLGANTIFNYSTADNQIDLQAGTMLFSKPKDGQPMTIKTAAVTAAVVGTTGFVQQQEHSFIFGLVEGHATLTVGGADYKITAGEILQLGPGGRPQTFFFNIPVFLKTSPLIVKYHTPLANQAYVDREVAEYNDFASRGFIAPPTQNLPLGGLEGFIPLVPIPATDSAANALQRFNNPPMPPPPPPAVSNNF